MPPGDYRFGPFRLDSHERLLMRDGRPVPMGPKLVDLLLVFLEHPGRILEREQLVARLWPDVFVGEQNLRQHVWMLRRALGDTGDDGGYVETIPRRGYRFRASVAFEPHPAEGEAPTAFEADSPAAPPRRRWRTALVASLALGALAALAALLWLGRSPGPESSGAQAPTLRRSVAVLGLRNLSAGQDGAWLAGAMADLLRAELSAGERLRVLPAETVSQARRDLSVVGEATLAPATLARLRRHLDVDLVLTGTCLAVRRGSSLHLRVDLALQDCTSGETVAVATREGGEADLPEIAAGLGHELRGRLGLGALSAGDALALRSLAPANPETARLYGEGLARLESFEWLAARDLLRQAVAAQPDFPLSHAALARAWKALGYDSDAREEAHRAVQLGARLPRKERLEVEATFHEADRNWPKAVELYRALWTVFPDEPGYGLALVRVQDAAGTPRDGLRTLAELRRLPEPLRRDPRLDLAEAQLAESLTDFAAEERAAARIVARSLERGSPTLAAAGRYHQAQALHGLGRLAEALTAVRESERLAAEAGEDLALGRAYNLEGIVVGDSGHSGDSRPLHDKALAIFRRIGQRTGEASALNNIAIVQLEAGQTAEGRATLLETLRAYREIRHRSGEAAVLYNLARLDYDLGQLARAAAGFREAREHFAEVGETASMQAAQAGEGDVLLELGRPEEARALLEPLLAELRQGGDKGLLGNTVASSLRAHVELADLPAARRLERELQRLADETGRPTLRALAAEGRGRVARAVLELDLARREQQEALRFWEQSGVRPAVTAARTAVARAALEAGDAAAAAEAAGRAARDFRVLRQADGEAAARAVAALARLALGDHERARAELAAARAASPSSENQVLRWELELAASAMEQAADRPAEAARRAGQVVTEAKAAGSVLRMVEALRAQCAVERSACGPLAREASRRGVPAGR